MEEVFSYAPEIEKEIEARDDEPVHSNWAEMIGEIIYLDNQPGNDTVS